MTVRVLLAYDGSAAADVAVTVSSGLVHNADSPVLIARPGS